MPTLAISEDRPLPIARPRRDDAPRQHVCTYPEESVECAINVLSMSLSPLPGEHKRVHHRHHRWRHHVLAMGQPYHTGVWNKSAEPSLCDASRREWSIASPRSGTSFYHGG